jgi:hypothetical protein
MIADGGADVVVDVVVVVVVVIGVVNVATCSWTCCRVLSGTSE